jgi:hypothetical protein
MSIVNNIIDDIESGLERLRSADKSTDQSIGIVTGGTPSLPVGPTALELELAKVLTDMIPPTYDRSHPYAATWDAARAVLAKVGK